MKSKKSKKLGRWASLVTLLVVLVGGWATMQTSYAQFAGRIYLPFLSSNGPIVTLPTPKDVRVDNVAISSLDNALYNIGISDGATRQQFINQEIAQRNGTGITGEQAYPAPCSGTCTQSEIDQLNIWGLGCFQGQGCGVSWSGTGGPTGWQHRSRFSEEVAGWTPLSVGVFCPAQTTCRIVSAIGGDNNPDLGQRRKWVLIQVTTVGFARFLERLCFWT